MKKMLILMLVLGVSSAGSANVIDLQISSINGEAIAPVSEITILPSDVVNLDIVYTDAIGGQTVIQLSCSVDVIGPGALDLTQLTIPPGMWDPDPTISPGVILDGTTMTYGAGMAGTGGLPGIIIDHILIHGETAGTVTVSLSDYVIAGLGSIDQNYMSIPYGPGVTIVCEHGPIPELCFNPGDPAYQNWVDVGYPGSWCCLYQHLGDCNGNGITQIQDLMMCFKPAYNSAFGGAGSYNPDADCNRDKFVNIKDLMQCFKPNYNTVHQLGYNCEHDQY